MSEVHPGQLENKARDTKRETGLYPRYAEFFSSKSKIANDWCDPM